MNFDSFMGSFLSWLVVLPSAVLCIAPMKNNLKKSFGATIRNMILVLLALITVSSVAESFLPSEYNAMTPVILVAAFVFYHHSLTVDITKSLTVFSTVCTLMSFTANISVLYDAYTHPTLDLDHASSDSTIFQLTLAVIFAVLFFFPMWKYGSRIVDRLDIRTVWIGTLPILSIFITSNIMTLPIKYETVHVNKIFFGMCMSLGLLFVLLLLLCIMFYFIVDGLIAASETRERNQFLEMQESHYHAVQRYMDETARVRHDFKHTIGALSDLAANGDVEAVRKYLEEYLEAQPHSDTVQYCSDTAVNAMLNHYAHRAVDQGIEMNLEIDLPASSSLPSLDQCSILGNILENAIIACENIPEEERYIDLLIRNDHGQIYIVASNSFDGKVRVKDGRYLTTHHRKGHGIGLSSITSTAEKNGGMVRFSHEGKEFNTDVLLPFRKEK